MHGVGASGADSTSAVYSDFYDHYFDLLTYLHARKGRLATFRDSVASRAIPDEQAEAEWSSYKGRERVLLRKRRTKLQLDQFHIVTQVGQGGYGEVYLARHKETHQVVALKKMKKKTLLKMDEVRRPPLLICLLFELTPPADSACTHRTRHPRLDQQPVACAPAVRLPGPDSRLPRHGWSPQSSPSLSVG